MKEKIKSLHDIAVNKITTEHISVFKWLDKPLCLISKQYPGLWIEHVYDSVMLARLEPNYLHVAENAVNFFIDGQKENGQLPFVVLDLNKRTDVPREEMTKYAQIQECVSFFTLALEVYEMNKDVAFLEKAYNAGQKWDAWLRKYRMTTNRGLIEMFVGFDTGHDKSGRLNGMAHDRNYSINGVVQNAGVCPNDDDVTPIIAVDMNCNFYGNETALSKMAKILGKDEESKKWENSAKIVKQKLFEICYDEKDAFFYDVDKHGNKRKYKSSTIFHLFLEKVLDKKQDKAVIDRIYNEHIKNPNEFLTKYPFPSMAIYDPSIEGHSEFNFWGYYTQALIVLRCSRWMDYYGYDKDYDYILQKWLETWTEHFETHPFAQEVDPTTGKPTESSQWYSSCMLSYIYGARRLGYATKK